MLIDTYAGNTCLLSSYNKPNTVPGTEAETLYNDPFMKSASEWDQTILGLLFFPRHKITLIMHCWAENQSKECGSK